MIAKAKYNPETKGKLREKSKYEEFIGGTGSENIPLFNSKFDINKIREKIKNMPKESKEFADYSKYEDFKEATPNQNNAFNAYAETFQSYQTTQSKSSLSKKAKGFLESHSGVNYQDFMKYSEEKGLSEDMNVYLASLADLEEKGHDVGEFLKAIKEEKGFYFEVENTKIPLNVGSPELKYIGGVLSENEKKSKFINLSGNYVNLPFNPKKLKGLVKLAVLPDYSPNKGLPTGSVAVFDEKEHEINSSYVGPDVGCGMFFGKFSYPLVDMENSTNGIASRVFDNASGKLGSLGGGNHFVTLYRVSDSNNPSFNVGDETVLIHTGSRKKGVDLFNKNLSGEKYLKEHDKTVKFAKDNREAIFDIVQKETGNKIEFISDNPHNYVENENGLVTYRKGLTKVQKGELTVIPSSMGGDAALVRAKDNISELVNSLPHGTGRKISRSDSKNERFFLDGFPEGVYLPYFLSPEMLITELPANYRTLEEALSLIKNYISVEAIMTPISSIMK
jgi:hypothetical protein